MPCCTIWFIALAAVSAQISRLYRYSLASFSFEPGTQRIQEYTGSFIREVSIRSRQASAKSEDRTGPSLECNSIIDFLSMYSRCTSRPDSRYEISRFFHSFSFNSASTVTFNKLEISYNISTVGRLFPASHFETA